MAITIPHSFTSGDIAEASEMNANFNEVKLYVDALSTGTNIDSNAITSAKINTSAVTTTKIADGAVTFAKLNSDVSSSLGSDDQIILSSQVFG